MVGQFPLIEYHLPDLMQFVKALVLDYESGNINSETILKEKVLAVFTADVMDNVELIAPGWRRMSSYANGETLVHVMSAFLALLLCPEYQNASIEEQTLLKWIVLYHDIAKEVVDGQRDAIHGFRSAAITGGSIAQVGFPITDEYHSHVEEWIAFTHEAIVWSDEAKITIQDNRQLPKIIDGINRIFGHNSAVALVVKTVLLHLSINVVEDWPQAAPLTDAETRQFIDAPLLPFLKVMMLVDNDAWALFDQPKKDKYRSETLAEFRDIEKVI
jgi:hypothetical protein